MKQEIAERRVRGLQKEFLSQVEAHPVLFQMEPDDFNDLRKRVFRGTFEAYRLGVVGLEKGPASMWEFFIWLGHNKAISTLDYDTQLEVNEMCLRTALEAFRIGAMVAGDKLRESP
jgi:hypothetical protein